MEETPASREPLDNMEPNQTSNEAVNHGETSPTKEKLAKLVERLQSLKTEEMSEAVREEWRKEALKFLEFTERSLNPESQKVDDENAQKKSESSVQKDGIDTKLGKRSPQPDSPTLEFKVAELSEKVTEAKEGETHLFSLEQISRKKDVFWLYLHGQGQPLIQHFLKEEYRDVKLLTEDEMDQLEVGDRVVARWNEDLELYRAVIERKWKKQENYKKTKFTVRFTDYGNSDCVEMSSIFKYKPALHKIPYQAFSCHLDEKHSEKVKKIFLKMVQDERTVQCKVETLDLNKHPQCKISFADGRLAKFEDLDGIENESRDESVELEHSLHSRSANPEFAYIYQWLNNISDSPENPLPPPLVEGDPFPKPQTEIFQCVDDEIEDRRNLSSPERNPDPKEVSSERSNTDIDLDDIFFSSEEDREAMKVQMVAKEVQINGLEKSNVVKRGRSEGKKCKVKGTVKGRETQSNLEKTVMSTTSSRGVGNNKVSISQKLVKMDNVAKRSMAQTKKPSRRNRKTGREESQTRTRNDSPMICPVFQRRNPVFLDNMIPQSLEVELQILMVVDPNHFYCLDIESNLEDFYDLLLEDFRNLMETEPAIASVDDLVPGSCWWINRQEPRRVRLVCTEPELIVQEIDHATFVTGVDELYWLPPGICSTVQGFSIRCHLAGLEAPTPGFTPESIQFFKNSYCGSILTGLIDNLDEETNSLGISVYSEHGDFINRILIDLKYAESTQPLLQEGDSGGNDQLSESSQSSAHAWMENWDPMREDYISSFNNYNTADDDLDVVLAGHRVSKDQCPRLLLFRYCPKGDFCPYSHNSLPYASIVGGEIEVPHFDVRSDVRNKLCPVKVVSVCNPSNFTVVVEYHSRPTGNLFLEEVSSAIQESVQKLDRNLELELGKMVGICLPTRGWVRGKITDDGDDLIAGCDEVSVYLVDHGVTVDAKVSDLWNVSNWVAMLPFFAVTCALGDIKPAHGIFWCHRSTEMLKRLGNMDTVKAKFLGAADGFNLVDLFYEVDSAWNSVATILCMNGVACKTGGLGKI